jgi:hypothetical protein
MILQRRGFKVSTFQGNNQEQLQKSNCPTQAKSGLPAQQANYVLAGARFEWATRTLPVESSERSC